VSETSELADKLAARLLGRKSVTVGPGLREEIEAAVAALRAVPAQHEPVAFVPIHPRQGPLWSDAFPAGSELPRSENYPRMALYAAPVPPADLAEVLANVRKGIAALRDAPNLRIPIELHKACGSLAHMVEDQR
jgi:hypothetical protein